MKFFCILILIALTQVSQAALYDYHPNSILYTGGGYNPFKPDKVYMECVDHDGIKPLDDFRDTNPTANRSDVMIQTVKSKRDFYQLISFSSHIQGSYSFYSGSASVSMVDERAFHSDSLSWIILFKTDYGKYGLDNPRLKSELRGLNAEELYRTCGSEIVTQERRGVMTYAVLTIKNLNEKKRYEFSQKLSVSAKGTLWDAKMEQNYQKVLRSAMSSTDFSVRIYAIGGKGVIDLTNLLGDEDDSFIKYQHIPKVMKDYIANQSVVHSVPTQYGTSDLSSFRNRLPVRYGDFKKGQFNAIYELWERLQSKFLRLDSLLYGSDRDNYDMTNEEEEKFAQQHRQYRQAMNEAFSAGSSCFESEGTCAIPSYSISPIKWPTHSKFYRLCEGNRKSALDKGQVPYEFYLMAKRRDLGFLIENGKVVGQEKCSELYF
jgi:hypothetical protein